MAFFFFLIFFLGVPSEDKHQAGAAAFFFFLLFDKPPFAAFTCQSLMGHVPIGRLSGKPLISCHPPNENQDMVPVGLPVFAAQKGHASALNSIRKRHLHAADVWFIFWVVVGGGDDLIGSWLDHYSHAGPCSLPCRLSRGINQSRLTLLLRRA